MFLACLRQDILRTKPQFVAAQSIGCDSPNAITYRLRLYQEGKNHKLVFLSVKEDQIRHSTEVGKLVNLILAYFQCFEPSQGRD